MKVIHEKEGFRKTYSLRINEEGAIVVKTNKLTTTKELEEIIKRHNRWIEKRISVFNSKSLELKLELKNGDIIQVLGSKYYLKLCINSKKVRPKVYFEDYNIIIESSKILNYEEKKEYVRKFLVKLSKEVFEERTAFYASKYNFKYNRISVKAQKSKWGSCSSKGNLNFNWKLLLFPIKILDYVVIHEVCHLKEMNHSSDFWDLVLIECPDYKNCRKWLRTRENTLIPF